MFFSEQKLAWTEFFASKVLYLFFSGIEKCYPPVVDCFVKIGCIPFSCVHTILILRLQKNKCFHFVLHLVLNLQISMYTTVGQEWSQASNVPEGPGGSRDFRKASKQLQFVRNICKLL